MGEVTPAFAVQFADALAGGPWTEAQAEALSHEVGKRLGADNDSSKKKRVPQVCFSFESFLTKKEVADLHGSASSLSKVNLLAKRAALIGLTNPNEQTVGHVVRLLAGLGVPELKNQKLFHAAVQDFKQCLKSNIKSLGYPQDHIKSFDGPENLPEEVKKRAYTEDDEMVEAGDIKTDDMAVVKVLRKSHRTVKDAAPSSSSTALVAAPGPVSSMGSLRVLVECLDSFFEHAFKLSATPQSCLATVMPCHGHAMFTPCLHHVVFSGMLMVVFTRS